MNNEKLNDKNFLLFCAAHYENHQYAATEDFLEDINRIKYIKKLITRYVEKNDMKERLILNHIIILNNCFGPEVLAKILYLKLKSYMPYVKPFLVLLNIMPETLLNVADESIVYTDTIPMDTQTVDLLRRI